MQLRRFVTVAVPCVRDGGDRADGGGFVEVHETQSWPADPGRYFLVRGGSLIAWSTEGLGKTVGNTTPFRIVGGHTDSPNLRVKQHPDLTSAGWQMVGLEPYGGAWLNSWLDRDLGISGRMSVRVGNTVEQKLVRIDDPILRVPQLAIHLSEDRKGVTLDPQRHVNGIWEWVRNPSRSSVLSPSVRTWPRRRFSAGN
ncbi:hypothetical protein GCM10020255_105540 [Rhodococcus baikonurensis]